MKAFEIVLPVLNEEVRLYQGVNKLLSFMRDYAQCRWHITIVDNGSTDSTAEIIKQIKASNQEVSSIYLDSPGVGNALRTAWERSNSDVVGYMDVDMSTDLSTMIKVFQYFEDNDGIFNASRNMPGSVVIGRSMKRTFTSNMLNRIFKIVFNIGVTDCMCGFKFLSKNAFCSIQKDGIRNNGWFFCAEILVLAAQKGYKIFEHPVIWTDSPEESKVRVVNLAKYYLKEICILKSSLFKQKRNW